jgi:sugar-phosphatase
MTLGTPRTPVPAHTPGALRARALLFDNDGTLVSTLASVRRCWTRWAVEYGVSAEQFGRVALHGRPAAEIAADLLPAAVVPAAVARIEELEVDDVPNGGVELLPGTREFLDALPADRWAVVTSATRRLGAARLDAVGIRPKVLVTADDVTRGKPDPEPYLLGARELGVDPAHCVVFEDAPAGLLAGRAAGMPTVGLVTTHEAGELDADLVVPNLAALSVRMLGGELEITVRR